MREECRRLALAHVDTRAPLPHKQTGQGAKVHRGRSSGGEVNAMDRPDVGYKLDTLYRGGIGESGMTGHPVHESSTYAINAINAERATPAGDQQGGREVSTPVGTERRGDGIPATGPEHEPSTAPSCHRDDVGVRPLGPCAHRVENVRTTGRRRCGTGKFEARKSVEPGGKMGGIQRENGSGYTLGRPGTVRRDAGILVCREQPSSGNGR
jgi:hypothetical protein